MDADLKELNGSYEELGFIENNGSEWFMIRGTWISGRFIREAEQADFRVYEGAQKEETEDKVDKKYDEEL